MSPEPATPEAHTPSLPASTETPPAGREPARVCGMRPLSGRERQILALLSQRRSYQEIANTLTLSPATVCCYRGRLLDRLGLSTTGELIEYAREHALTRMPMVVIKRGRIGFDRTQMTQSETIPLCNATR